MIAVGATALVVRVVAATGRRVSATGRCITRVGQELVIRAAEYSELPPHLRPRPETDDEAKARMRGDYQDWTSAIRADMGRGKSATVVVPMDDLLPDSDDDWPEGLGQRLQARQWLVDQKANPTWETKPAPWKLAAWPFWQRFQYRAIFHAHDVRPDVDQWRPLILPGMDLDRRDGVMLAGDLTPAALERVKRWQYQSRVGWHEIHMDTVVGAQASQEIRPAIWAELDED